MEDIILSMPAIKQAKTGRKRKRISGTGYLRMFYPCHPNADKGGSVALHRVIMELFLDRYLESDEEVHHINGIVSDNRIENLELVTKRSHAICHLTGKERTEETKRKLSEAHSGEKNWRFGKPLSEETKTKISNANKGRKRSEESRQRMIEAQAKRGDLSGPNSPSFGRRHTEDAKKKMGWFKGGKHSDETRQKMSQSAKGKIKTEEHKQKLRESFQRPESKRLRSEASKKAWLKRKGLL